MSTKDKSRLCSWMWFEGTPNQVKLFWIRARGFLEGDGSFSHN